MVERLFQGAMRERSSSTPKISRRKRDRLNSLPGNGQRMISDMLCNQTTKAINNSLEVQPIVADKLSEALSGGVNQCVKTDEN